MIMLRTARGRAAAAPLPPEEVKLYAQRVASAIHTWAELADVCRIVDAKSKLPGMMLCKEHLREAVLAELDAKRTALEAQIASTREERDAMSDCEADGVAALHEKVCSCLLTYCKPRSYGTQLRTYLLTSTYLQTYLLPSLPY